MGGPNATQSIPACDVLPTPSYALLQRLGGFMTSRRAARRSVRRVAPNVNRNATCDLTRASTRSFRRSIPIWRLTSKPNNQLLMRYITAPHTRACLLACTCAATEALLRHLPVATSNSCIIDLHECSRTLLVGSSHWVMMATRTD